MNYELREMSDIPEAETPVENAEAALTGSANDPRTYGHFGRAGRLLARDPDPDLLARLLLPQHGTSAERGESL